MVVPQQLLPPHIPGRDDKQINNQHIEVLLHRDK
jgi:hypothetical protein